MMRSLHFKSDLLHRTQPTGRRSDKGIINTSYSEEKQLYHVMVNTGLFAHICLKWVTFIEAKLLRLCEGISGYCAVLSLSPWAGTVGISVFVPGWSSI